MRIVVLGRNGVGSRSHYITGYHDASCICMEYHLSLFPMGTISYGRGCNIIQNIINKYN